MHRSLPDIFFASAREHAGRPAVLNGGGSITYEGLAAAVELFAGRLQELGLMGSRIGVLLPNTSIFPVAFLGAQSAGCSTLLLNSANSRREVAEYLAAAEVSTVITAGELAPLLPHGTQALLVDGLPDTFRISDGADPREVPLRGAPDLIPPGTGPEDEACVLFTAADAGWARGAVLTHGNLLANMLSTIQAMAVTADDCVVGALPYIHAFGLTVTLNAPLAAGASILPVERFRPQRILASLTAQPATVFAGVPAMYIGLISAAERGDIPEHRLRLAIGGGAAFPLQVALRWEELFGIPLRQGYGLTEAGPVCLFNQVNRPNIPGTLGYCFPGVEVSMRDPEGDELPRGEVGELCVRGPNVFRGYAGEGGRSDRDFHEEWFRTGDLASCDEEGIFRFHGMLKPMFTRNGFNVYPRELERVIQSEPDVEQARVLALPDAQRENEIVLQVKLVAGSEIEVEQIRGICRDRLAAYKQPGRIEIER
ncbi:long-chain-fatty-acid--CoA ligase LcfB [soil metagenome]